MQKIKALYTPNHTLACSYLKQAWTTQAQTKNDRIVLIKQTRAKLAKHLKTRRHKCYKLACATGKQAGIQEVIKQYQECEAKQKILLEELTQNITSQIIKLTKAVILDELSSNPKIIAKRVSAAISQLSQKSILQIRLPTDSDVTTLPKLIKKITIDPTLASGNFSLVLENGTAQANWEEQLDYLVDI